MYIPIIYCPTDLVTVGLLGITTFTLVGLIAIWASRPGLHWFPRIVFAGGLLSLGMMIPAYELVLIFLIQATVVILAFAIAKHYPRRSGQPIDVAPHSSSTELRKGQFSVSDLLLVVPVVAAFSALAAQVPKEIWANWRYFVGFGVSFGCLTAMAAWCVFAKAPAWLRFFVFLLSLPAVLVVAWLAIMRASRLPAQADRNRRVFAWMARATGLVLTTGILAPPMAVFFLLMTPPPIPAGTLPDPNGYEELVRVSQNLDSVPDAETASMMEIRTFLSENRENLDSIRTALSLDCCVPPPYFELARLGNVSAFRDLVGMALMAEGKLAELEGRTADAARAYINRVHLGHVTANGGMIIDFLFGEPRETDGLMALYRLDDGLTSEDYRNIAAAMESLNARWESPDVVFARDTAWRCHFYGWRWGLRSILDDFNGENERVVSDLDGAAKGRQARMRVLIGNTALRRYRLDKGIHPERLEDLVPEYLPEVPMDPFNEEALSYRRTSTGYLLYSVGPDRNDDNGRPLYGNHGDIVLEQPVASPFSGDTD